MKNFLLFFIILFFLNNFSYAKENLASVDSLFHIDQMNSHDENFALYFIAAKIYSIQIIHKFPTNHIHIYYIILYYMILYYIPLYYSIL